MSFTEGEYEAAAKIPRLLFFASDDLPMPSNLREEDDLWKLQQSFRKRVMTERIGDFFSTPDSLATQVMKALGNLPGKTKTPKPLRTKPPADLKATETYLKYLVERYRYLDFKGFGVSDRVPLRLPLLEMYVPLKARVEAPEGVAASTRRGWSSSSGRALRRQGRVSP